MPGISKQTHRGYTVNEKKGGGYSTKTYYRKKSTPGRAAVMDIQRRMKSGQFIEDGGSTSKGRWDAKVLGKHKYIISFTAESKGYRYESLVSAGSKEDAIREVNYLKKRYPSDKYKLKV